MRTTQICQLPLLPSPPHLISPQTMMELVKGRKRLTELEARYYSLQLLSAMRYLHAHAIIHRDLKLGNLFLSDGMQIRVGDFGLATQLTHPEERKRTICGTPNYIAPEVLDGKDGHSFEVDVWAFGVILYTMIIGKPPFETTDVKHTYKRIRENAYSFPDHVPISAHARSLITAILRPVPADRLTVEEIVTHEFFTAPDALVPTVMPTTALAEPPTFELSQLEPCLLAVQRLMAAPVGSLLASRRSGGGGGSGRDSGAAPSTGGSAVVPPGHMYPYPASHGARLEPVPDTTGGSVESLGGGGSWSAASSVPSLGSTTAAAAAAAVAVARGRGPSRGSVDTGDIGLGGLTEDGGYDHGNGSGDRDGCRDDDDDDAMAGGGHGRGRAGIGSSAAARGAHAAPDWRAVAAGLAGWDKENATPHAAMHMMPMGGVKAAAVGMAAPLPLRHRADNHANPPVDDGERAFSDAESGGSLGGSLEGFDVGSGARTPSDAVLGPLHRASSAPTLSTHAHAMSVDCDSAPSSTLTTGSHFPPPPAAAGLARPVPARAAPPAVPAPPPSSASTGSGGSAGMPARRVPLGAVQPNPTASGAPRKALGTLAAGGSLANLASSSTSTPAVVAAGSCAVPGKTSRASTAAAAPVLATVGGQSGGVGVGSFTRYTSATSGSIPPAASLGRPAYAAQNGRQPAAPAPLDAGASVDCGTDDDEGMGVSPPPSLVSVASFPGPPPLIPAVSVADHHMPTSPRAHMASPPPPPLIPAYTRASSSSTAAGVMQFGAHPPALVAIASAPAPVPSHAHASSLPSAGGAATSGRGSGGGGVSLNDTLEMMLATVSSAFKTRLNMRGRLHTLTPTPDARPRVWVTTWVDYSCKYGLGYQLSNGAVGVYFNDSTKMVVDAAGGRVEYIERHSHGQTPPVMPAESFPVVRGRDGVYRLRATMAAHPAGLKKKVVLVRHFQGYLAEQVEARRAETAAAAERHDGNMQAAAAALPHALPLDYSSAEGLPTASSTSAAFSNDGTVTNSGLTLFVSTAEDDAARAADDAVARCRGDNDALAAEPHMSDGSGGVYVRKWLRTRRAIIFRLSNGTLQLCFFDGSAMLLSGAGGTVTYVDRAGESVSLPSEALVAAAAALSPADATSPGGGSGVTTTVHPALPLTPGCLRDAVRRFKYCRDVLTQLSAPLPSAISGAGSAGGHAQAGSA